MIVDSSAVVAIIRGEPERDEFVRLLRAASRRALSAATFVESAIVVDRADDPTESARFDELVNRMPLVIQPVNAQQAGIARQAYRDFGKGSGHPAQLNFGDCFSYALAIETGEPLLYKGADFRHTGVRSALDH